MTVLAVAVAVAQVGCGDGDGGRDDVETPSRSEFAKQANAICVPANEELTEAVIEVFGADGEPTASEGIRFTHEIWVPNLRDQIADLRALTPPAGDEALVGELLDGLEAATDKVSKNPAATATGPFDAVTERWRDYGISACGSP